MNPGPPSGYAPPYGAASAASVWRSVPGAYQAPPYQAPPFTPVTDPSMPGVPPPPPQALWRRKEPIGAIVLIALGVLFLLGQIDEIGGVIFKFTWPLLLIGLGVWLVVRRMGETQGGPR